MPDWYRDQSLSPDVYSEAEFLDWCPDNSPYVDAARSATVKFTAGRPAARQVTMRAEQRARGDWVAILGAPEESTSLWVWSCDHRHPDQFQAGDCAIAERKRLMRVEAEPPRPGLAGGSRP